MHTQYTCGIYKLTAPDGRCYIGSSVRVEKRLRQHRWSLAENKHYNGRLQRAWNTHGHFDFEIVERCEQSMLKEREQYWMDELQPYLIQCGFNIARSSTVVPGSEERNRHSGDALKGHPTSEETRRKMSDAQRGISRRPHTEEEKRKIGEASKGHKLSEESRQKISKARKGIVFSPETIRKMSEAKKGRQLSDETKQKMSNAQRLRWAEVTA